MPEIFRNRFFYISLALGSLLVLPFYLIKFNRNHLMQLYSRYHGIKEDSAITPDISRYRLPRPGQFSAVDYVHFRLEYINALISAPVHFRRQNARHIYSRYGINEREIKTFLARPGVADDIASCLRANPSLAKKLSLAEKEAAKKNMAIPF